MATSSQKIASGVFWSILTNIVGAIYSFITVPILLNYFGKAEYGLIGLAGSVNVYMGLLDMGLGTTNARFYANWISNGKLDETRKLFSTSLSFYGVVGLLNGLILAVIAIFADKFFNVSPEQCSILRHLLSVLVISSVISWMFSSLNQIIYADENVAWMKKRDLLMKIYSIAVLFATVYLKLSIEMFFVLSTFSFLILAPVNVNKIRKDFSFISFIPGFDKTTFKSILPYSLSIFSFGLFQFFFKNIGPVFLGMRGTVEMVADYRIMGGIVGIVSMVTGVFMGSMLPSTYKAVAKHNQEAKDKLAYDGTKYVTIALCFCAFGMMCVSSDLLCLYVGEGYLYLTSILNLWLLTTIGGHTAGVASLVMAGTDVKPLAYMSAVSSFTGLALTWFLIPYYGVDATVYALFVYTFLQTLFFYVYFMKAKLEINPRIVFRCFIPYTIAGGVAFFFVQLWNFSDLHLLNIFLKGCLFSLIYFTAVYVLLSKSDIIYLKKMVHIKD